MTGKHEAVSYAAVDGVALVTLARPEAMNAISPELLHGLQVAFQRAVDDGVRGLVLTGEGRGFCAGADLRRAAELLAMDDDWVAMWAFNAAGNRALATLRDLPFVTVAAVNGAAAGAGIGYALATDFRVFARSAQLVPRFAGLGVTPDNASSYFVTHFLGAAKAARFFLRNEPMPADDVLTLGIADLVVEDTDVVSAALTMAKEHSDLSAQSLRGIRTLTASAYGHSLGDHLELESTWAAEAWPVFRERAEAFFTRP